MFRAGEFTNETWFSRFQGDGQLTEVEGQYTPKRAARGPRRISKTQSVSFMPPVSVPQAGPCSASCQTGCQNTCELACESAKQQIVVYPNYEHIGTSYYCRHCDWSTTDLPKVTEHMEHYHPAAGAGPGQEQGPAKTTDPEGEPRASGASVPRSPDGKSAVPPQAPVSSGSVENAEEQTVWWFRSGGELHCKTCAVVGHGWKTSHRDAMDRHCMMYHEMPESEKNKEPVIETPAAKELTEEPEAVGFKCEVCGRSFKTKGGLSTHKRFCKKP